MLLAQCLNAVDCQLPRSLPWWFSVAMVAAWLALLVAIVKLVRWRRRSRRGRRDGVATPAPWDEGRPLKLEPWHEAEPAVGEVSGRPGARGEAG